MSEFDMTEEEANTMLTVHLDDDDDNQSKSEDDKDTSDVIAASAGTDTNNNDGEDNLSNKTTDADENDDADETLHEKSSVSNESSLKKRRITIAEYMEMFKERNPRHGRTKIYGDNPTIFFVRPRVRMPIDGTPALYVCEGLQCMHVWPPLNLSRQDVVLPTIRTICRSRMFLGM